MASYIRLYLVPQNGQQQVIDIDVDSLVLSKNQFVPIYKADSVTLVRTPVDSTYQPFSADAQALTLSNAQTQDVRICWREPVGTDEFPDNEVVVVPDPTDGQCVCGVTCLGPQLSYVTVSNVQQ